MEPLGKQISRLRDSIDDVSTQLSLHAARLKRHIQSAVARAGGCRLWPLSPPPPLNPVPPVPPSPPCAAQRKQARSRASFTSLPRRARSSCASASRRPSWCDASSTTASGCRGCGHGAGERHSQGKRACAVRIMGVEMRVAAAAQPDAGARPQAFHDCSARSNTAFVRLFADLGLELHHPLLHFLRLLGHGVELGLLDRNLGLEPPVLRQLERKLMLKLLLQPKELGGARQRVGA